MAKKSGSTKPASRKAGKASIAKLKTAKKATNNTAGKAVKKMTKKVVKKVIEKKVKKIAKVKSPLSAAELKEFRQMLLDKRMELLGDMSGMEAEALRLNRQEGSGDLSNIPTHLADAGTDNFEQEFTLGLLESEHTLLGEINEALERIEDGVFGICLGTGKLISKPRLRARPWAKYCIEYARKVEKGLARPGIDEEED